MNVVRDSVVRFHYTLTDVDADTVVEDTRENAPVVALIGHRNILVGLEDALKGKGPGEAFEVELPPERAFGPRQPDRTQRISKKYFRAAAKLKPGMSTSLQTEQGPRQVTVLKVGSKVVDVDLNHPLAGRTLRFAGEIVEVREATKEEIAHGHVHGDGGHAH